MITNKNTEKTGVSTAYERNVLEFVTVAVEYCAFLEQSECKTREEFTDTLLKLIPLLYLKAVLMPKYELLSDEYIAEDFVTEENYDIVRGNIACVMSDKDDYLDVFVEDMKYSESPILCTISENLSDIYQELKNFVMNYKNAVDDEQTFSVLAVVKETFQYSWGQKMVNVLRALHEVRYTEEDDY